MVVDKIGRNGIFQEDDQREMLLSPGFVGSRHLEISSSGQAVDLDAPAREEYYVSLPNLAI